MHIVGLYIPFLASWIHNCCVMQWECEIARKNVTKVYSSMLLALCGG